ncbi:MAG TPA: Spy/CpxP family protein refolding chaperone [Pyrinomonadaceae bacterium]|nr:Spy/CpxP family protein refolding chaperone [Pyrinomonadaceae bacterium]
MKRLGKIRMLIIVGVSILSIAAISAVALSVPIAVAQTARIMRGGHERGERRGGPGEGMRGGMFRGINLTDDQKAKMKQISESFRESTKALRQDLQTKREALHQANEGGTFDEASTTQKLTDLAPLEAKLMGEQFKMRQETLSVLTPEQKTQLEQKRAEFKAREGERRGRKGE